MKTSTLLIVAGAAVVGFVLYRKLSKPQLVNTDGTTPIPTSPSGNTGIVPGGIMTAPPPPRQDGIFGAITTAPTIRSAVFDRAFNTR
jgi:hypothetical protein